MVRDIQVRLEAWLFFADMLDGLVVAATDGRGGTPPILVSKGVEELVETLQAA